MSETFNLLGDTLRALTAPAFDNAEAKGFKEVDISDQAELMGVLTALSEKLSPYAMVVFMANFFTIEVMGIEREILEFTVRLRKRSKSLRVGRGLTKAEVSQMVKHTKKKRVESFELLAKCKELMEQLAVDDAAPEQVKHMARTYLANYDTIVDILHDYTWLHFQDTPETLGLGRAKVYKARPTRAAGRRLAGWARVHGCGCVHDWGCCAGRGYV